jgi:hydroxymethylglutaryl-CoA lyase
VTRLASMDWASLRGQRVRVVEVGPRDGLQNEPSRVTTADKVQFVNRLSEAGFSDIEVTAFVNPARVPQMADATEVLRGIERRPGTRYSALVPNQQGLARAIDAGADAVAIFAAATETFSLKNINKGIDESLALYERVITDAGAADLPTRGYLSVAFGCPYEGPVDTGRVAAIAEQLMTAGVSEVAISDTIGIAHPGDICRVLDAVLSRVPAENIALHLHDTRGTALANVVTALSYGIATFDSSAGGLGGCPFAPGAAGNLGTEDLLFALHGLGIVTGVSLDRVSAATRLITAVLGGPPRSRFAQASRG